MSSELKIEIRDQDRPFPKEVVVPRPFAIVGAGDGSDVDIDGPFRLYLQSVGQGVVPIDLTRFGERKDPAPTRLLSDKERLQVGPYSILAEVPRQVQGLVRTDADLQLPNRHSDELALRFVNAHSRAGQKSSRRLRETITLIGSCNRCHLKLSHPEIPRFHSSVVRNGEETLIVSLTRECELQVNGRVVRFSRLTSGDIVSIGPFLMQYQERTPSDVTVFAGNHSLNRPTPTHGQPNTEDERYAELSVTGDDAGADDGKAGRTTTNAELMGKSSAEWDVMSPASDSDIVALVRQVTEVYQMLMEQSQQQTSLLLHVLSNVKSEQSGNQDLLREQIAAIQSITSELQHWRKDLQVKSSETAQQQPPTPMVWGLPYPAAQLPAPPPMMPHTAPQSEPRSHEDIAAHASVEDRIKLLERERNSLIRKIMRLLQNPSANPH